MPRLVVLPMEIKVERKIDIPIEVTVNRIQEFGGMSLKPLPYYVKWMISMLKKKKKKKRYLLFRMRFCTY